MNTGFWIALLGFCGTISTAMADHDGDLAYLVVFLNIIALVVGLTMGLTLRYG